MSQPDPPAAALGAKDSERGGAGPGHPGGPGDPGGPGNPTSPWDYRLSHEPIGDPSGSQSAQTAFTVTATERYYVQVGWGCPWALEVDRDE
jgi:hypothetical protein